MVWHISLFISLTPWKQGVSVLPTHGLCCQQMCNPENAFIAAATEVRMKESQLTDNDAIKLMTSRLCHES